MMSVRICAYELEVEVASNEQYPDLLDDLCNRAIIAFNQALGSMLNAGIALADAEETE